MSIKYKVFLMINTFCMMSLIGIYIFSKVIIGNNIDRQEKRIADENIQRAVIIMNKEIDALTTTCGDWSFWDETYYFLKGENSSYIEDNLNNSSVETLKLNIMVYVDANGKVKYTKGHDMESDEEIDFSEDVKRLIAKDSIINHTNIDSVFSGITTLKGKPALIVTRPITRSEKRGGMIGTLIIGRFINQGIIDSIEQLTNSKVEIYDSNKKLLLPAKMADDTSGEFENDKFVAQVSLGNSIEADPMQLKLTMSRDLYNESHKNLQLFMKMFLAVTLVISIFAMFSTQRLFLGRIEKLNSFVNNVISNKDAKQSVYIDGSDEIARLAKATNYMLRTIEEANGNVRHNEERLKLVLEGSNDGFWDINLATGAMYLSPRLLELLGYEGRSRDNALSIMKEVLSEEAFRGLIGVYKSILAGSLEDYKEEYLVLTRSGEAKWLLFKGKVFRHETDNRPYVMAGTASDITETKQRTELIEYLSFHDSLTGIYNRHFFLNELDKLGAEENLPLSLIMGDVNGLKQANDTFGHNEGDKLLIAVSKILKESAGEKGIVARLGGDEFVVILPNKDEKYVEQICKTIKLRCEQSELRPIKPSISLGTITKTNIEEDINKLLEVAEDRMYKNKLLENSSPRHSIIALMERALQETDYETQEHTERLCELALRMGKHMKLPANQLDELRLISKLHDIGKTAIPREILTKPDRLTQEEWLIIKKHPEIGHRMAMSSYELMPIAESILSHHEKWDGSGYPKSIKGEEIPLIARIISIVDAYDVITNSRPYKKAATHKEALDEIERCSGTHFDPKLARIFIDMFNEKQTTA